jgi:thiaminase/transcriptional activator TenA
MQPSGDFSGARANQPDLGFCEWLRRSSGPLWDAMVCHRFMQDMASDRLPPKVFVRYLRYEHAFVRSAIVVFGHSLIAAPTTEDRARIVGILEGLVGEQEVYFRTRFEELGLTPEPLCERQLPDAALALCEGALAIAAHGCFEEILSAMVAAEWMYLEWCQKAMACAPRDPAPAEWIALHVAPGFADQVGWLRGRLETLGPRLDADRQLRCADHFTRMLRLEIAFHDAPYGSSGSSAAAG